MVYEIKANLEKCPFCEGESGLFLTTHPIDNKKHVVRLKCKECGASIPQTFDGDAEFGEYITLDKAIEKLINRWNRRESGLKTAKAFT